MAAKLSSQSSSICGKTLPLQLSLCQLPWAEEEEEDDSEEVVMKGFIEMLRRAGLHCLLFRTFQDLSHIFWHSRLFKTWQSKCFFPLSLPVALSAALVGFATCTGFTSTASLKPQVQGKSRAQTVLLGQEHKNRIFTSWNKTFDQVTS